MAAGYVWSRGRPADGSMPDSLADLTETQSMIVLAVGVPAMVAVGIILPFAGLFSLYKSWLMPRG